MAEVTPWHSLHDITHSASEGWNGNESNGIDATISVPPHSVANGHSVRSSESSHRLRSRSLRGASAASCARYASFSSLKRSSFHASLRPPPSEAGSW